MCRYRNLNHVERFAVSRVVTCEVGGPAQLEVVRRHRQTVHARGRASPGVVTSGEAAPEIVERTVGALGLERHHLGGESHMRGSGRDLLTLA